MTNTVTTAVLESDRLRITERKLNICLLSNQKKNLVESGLEKSLVELFSSEIFRNQGLSTTNVLRDADCVFFMISENFTEKHFQALSALPDNVVKIGFLTSGAEPIFALDNIKNLIVVTHSVHTDYSVDALKAVLKIGKQAKLIRLPLSPFVSQEHIAGLSKIYTTDYNNYLAHIGYYEIMANSLPKSFTELEIVCPDNAKALELEARLIYSNGRTHVHKNSCIIKVTNLSTSELYALQEHAAIKLLKIMRKALLQQVA